MRFASFAEINRALADPKMRVMAAETEKWSKVVQASGAKVE